ncbi:MAG: hypothetical protein SOU19_06390 [Candidatus Caccosoma sp.]|nr:hypothetical protein [Candidatus Caccosoma sp.]
MDLIKNERVNNLLDIYEPLLTNKQKEIMEMYYIYDLSLAEIALDNKTTRSAVFDLIKRTTNTLENYESKLHLLDKKEKIHELLKDIDENIKNKIEDLL